MLKNHISFLILSPAAVMYSPPYLKHSVLAPVPLRAPRLLNTHLFPDWSAYTCLTPLPLTTTTTTTTTEQLC